MAFRFKFVEVKTGRVLFDSRAEPVSSKMTDRQLFAAVRALGMTVRKNEGEYRVAHVIGSVQAPTAERQEATAHYTCDKHDALGTAKAMQAEVC